MVNIDFLAQNEVVDFIMNNVKLDVSRFLLNPPNKWKDKAKLIADQIQSRQKAVGKLDAWAVNRELVLPPPLSMEQASSKASSEYKSGLLNGSLLVDLTGGAGIDCLALSDQFEKTIYVEQSATLCKIFEYNAAALNKKISVKNTTAEVFLSSCNGHGAFYIDPARRDINLKKVTSLEQCTPNLKELLPQFKSKRNRVLVKLSPLLDIQKTIEELPNVKEVHVVAVKNDCKELLFLIEFGFQKEPQIHAVNLETENEPLVFKRVDEQQAKMETQPVEKYLYEPNTAILKSGAFKLIGEKYQTNKVASNTHLYSSNRLIAHFPGKAFEILHLNAKPELPKYAKKINVITRNYPINATDLKKKFKLTDGGEHYLVGFRDHQNLPRLVIASRHY